jgi:hypothetical protein
MPRLSTSQAWGILAPGRVVACRWSCGSRRHTSSPAAGSGTTAGHVALVHLDALGVELGVLELQRRLHGLARRHAFRPRVLEAGDAGRHRVVGAFDAEGGLEGRVVEARLVGRATICRPTGARSAL